MSLQGGQDQSLLTDEGLVERARAGSDEAFEELILRYRSLVTRVARRYVSNLADAEDLAQDAFVRAYQKLGKLKPGVPFKNWVIRITVNLCLDRIRKLKRHPEETASQMDEREPNWLDRRLSAHSKDEEKRRNDARDAQELLRKVLPTIAPKDQAVLHLLYGEGLDVAEVAELLGWTEVNVRVRAFRARRTLKKALETLIDGSEEG
ncbi:MAG: sigma-70 family RNA polymerase sigma factor [Acidobacteriota bacterium]